MKQILILIITIMLQGCFSLKDFSLVYAPDINQGNIITPEMVAQLQPGMSKRQVRFVMGTPVLEDVFHADRWDYTYSVKRRNEPIEIKQFSVYFRGDTLVHFTGDIEPARDLEEAKDKKEIVLSVPDYKEEKGLFGWLGF